MSSGKCMRPGPITSNGYLNFLREYRRCHCGLSPKETVCRGARAWNRLTCAQKQKYRRMGNKKRKRGGCRRKRKRSRCRKKRKKRNRCARKRRRSSCRRRRPRCGRKKRKRRSKCRRRRKRSSCGSKKRCMRQGRVTNNGYLNFLRWFRKCHCGLTPQETVRRGARKWCSLPEREKKKFSAMGRKKRCRRRC